MIWLAIRLFMGKALERLLSAFGLIRQYPWQAAVIALSVAFAWTLHGKHGVERERDAARSEITAMIEASKANRIAAERQAHEQQSKLDQITKAAENDHKAITKDADSRLAAYIKRMRIKNDCISPAPAPTEGNNPSVPADVPPDSSMVAIRSDELQNLIDWFKVGLSAHNQAVDKVNSGAALPDPAFGR